MTGLDVFLTEVVALAHQLRKTDFRAQQGNGLLAAGRRVLQILDQQGPRTVPAIAASQNSSRQNVQIIADRFACAGLVRFVANPAHKKSELLEITNEGQQALAASAGLENKVLQEFVLELKDSEWHTAIDVLRRVRQELALKESHLRPARATSPPAENEEADDGSLPVNLL